MAEEKLLPIADDYEVDADALEDMEVLAFKGPVKLDITVEQLYNYCILASVASEIYASENIHDRYWDENNFIRDNGCGDDGIISFADGICVGVFRDHESERSNYEYGACYPAMKYLEGAPNNVRELAKREALQYCFSEDFYVGENEVPCITTAFWGNSEGVFTNDSKEDFMNNGGRLAGGTNMMDLSEITDFEESIADIRNNYGFTDEQIELVKFTYAERIKK